MLRLPHLWNSCTRSTAHSVPQTLPPLFRSFFTSQECHSRIQLPASCNKLAYHYQEHCSRSQVPTASCNSSSSHLIFDADVINILWRKDMLFSRWCWEIWTSSCRRGNYSSILITYPIQKLIPNGSNTPMKVLKQLVDKVGKILWGIGSGRTLDTQ